MEVINQKKDHWGGRHNEYICIGFQIREQNTSNRVSYCRWFRPVRGTFSLFCLFRWKIPELNGGFHRNITFKWSIFQHDMFILPDGKSWDNQVTGEIDQQNPSPRAGSTIERAVVRSQRSAVLFSHGNQNSRRKIVQGFNAIPSGND